MFMRQNLSLGSGKLVNTDPQRIAPPALKAVSCSTGLKLIRERFRVDNIIGVNLSHIRSLISCPFNLESVAH